MDRIDLDELLKTRYVPQAPEGLAAQIIAASHRTPQGADAGWKGAAGGGFIAALGGVLEGFFLVPRPVYALAVLLVIGFYGGMNGDLISGYAGLPGITDSDLSSIMEIDDRFVASEFLDSEDEEGVSS